MYTAKGSDGPGFYNIFLHSAILLFIRLLQVIPKHRTTVNESNKKQAVAHILELLFHKFESTPKSQKRHRCTD